MKNLKTMLSGLLLLSILRPVHTLANEQALDFISGNTSATEKFRLIWCSDPTREAIIAWNQTAGDPGTVHFDARDHKRHASRYAKTFNVDRTTDFLEMTNCFVRLEGLTPDTDYYFVIKDQAGVSPRFTFRTASDQPTPFTFIAGGDSRNGRDARQAGNMICAKLKPLFIAFTGDMISRDNAECWTAWFDDWQLTVDDQGRMIPIVPHRGNHESTRDSIYNLFDTPRDAYYAISIGGNLFRHYTLNSMIPADGEQGTWLKADLEKYHEDVTHLTAGYHHPMRPHTQRKSEGRNPYKWADTFYTYGIDLALESDTHMIKRTQPVKPASPGDEGFEIAEPGDKNAIVFTGEGSWGAPLRPADDEKSWTIDSASFSGFDWIAVSPQNMQIKTVDFKNSSKMASVDKISSFETPADTLLWQAKGGEVLTIPAD